MNEYIYVCLIVFIVTLCALILNYFGILIRLKVWKIEFGLYNKDKVLGDESETKNVKNLKNVIVHTGFVIFLASIATFLLFQWFIKPSFENAVEEIVARLNLIQVKKENVVGRNVDVQIIYDEVPGSYLNITDEEEFGVTLTSLYVSKFTPGQLAKIKLYLVGKDTNVLLLSTETSESPYTKHIKIHKGNYGSPGKYKLIAQIEGPHRSKLIDELQLEVENHDWGNTIPYIISSNKNLVIDEGLGMRMKIKAQDLDGDKLRYSLIQQPSFLTIDQETGVVSGKIPYVDSDFDYVFTVRAHDGKDFTMKVFHFKVKNVHAISVKCPSCGHEFDADAGGVTCDDCGHEFYASSS